MSKLSVFLLGTTGFVLLGFPVLGMLEKDPKKSLGVNRRIPPPIPPKHQAPFRRTKGEEAPPPAPSRQIANPPVEPVRNQPRKFVLPPIPSRPTNQDPAGRQRGATVSEPPRKPVSPPVPSRLTNQDPAGRPRGASVSEPKEREKRPLPDLPNSSSSCHRTQPSRLEKRRQELEERRLELEEARQKIENGWRVSDEEPEKGPEEPMVRNLFDYVLKGELDEEVSYPNVCKLFDSGKIIFGSKGDVEIKGKVKVLETSTAKKAVTPQYIKKYFDYLSFKERISDPKEIDKKYNELRLYLDHGLASLVSPQVDTRLTGQIKDTVVRNYEGTTVGELKKKGKKAKGDLIRYGFAIDGKTILKVPFEDYTGKNLVPLTFQLSVTQENLIQSK